MDITMGDAGVDSSGQQNRTMRGINRDSTGQQGRTMGGIYVGLNWPTRQESVVPSQPQRQ